MLEYIYMLVIVSLFVETLRVEIATCLIRTNFLIIRPMQDCTKCLIA